MIILAILSIVVGFVELPHNIGNFHLFTDFLNSALPSFHVDKIDTNSELALEIIAGIACFLGVLISYVFYFKRPEYPERFFGGYVSRKTHSLWQSGWGFDWIYDSVFVRPFVRITRLNRNDFVDSFYALVSFVTTSLHKGLSFTQTGRLRQYALGISIGAVLVLWILVWL